MDTQNKPSSEALLCCRACLSADLRLFNIHQYKLGDAFALVTGTIVKRDKFPQHLCGYCGMQLLKSASFRDMCLRAQEALSSEVLKEKLDLDCIRRKHPNRLDLTVTEVKTVECIEYPPGDVKEEPSTNEVTITNKPINIIKTSGSKTETEPQKRVLIIPDDIFKYVKKRDINKPANNDDDNNGDITENIIKIEIEEEATKVKIKKELEIEYEHVIDDTDDVSDENIDITPLKRRKEDNQNVVLKKRMDIKTLCKDKHGKETKTTESTKKLRKAENGFMPVFDFAKFESENAMKIVVLSKEEQLEEMESRKKLPNYLESTFKCEACGKGFNAQAAYNNHLKRHDPSEGEFACEVCALRYKQRCKMQKHQDVHRMKFVCNECGFVTRNRAHAKDHHKMHTGKTYQCQHCEKTFCKPSSYINHVRMSHSTHNLSCDLCGDTFVGARGLQMHKKRMHSEKSQQFKCTTCSATFISVEALNRHSETAREHSDLRPCEQCGENCASEQALHEHVKEKHSTETYRCNECEMCFRNSAAYETHTRRKHRGQRALPTDGEYNRSLRNKRRWTFVCDQCGRVMKNVTMFRYHLLQHQNVKLACNECPKTYGSKETLRIHMRSHTNERPYQCAECPLAFSRKGSFNRHHKTAHLGIRDNVPCDICGRVYSTKGALTLHMNTVHYGKPGPKRDRKKAKRTRANTSNS